MCCVPQFVSLSGILTESLDIALYNVVLITHSIIAT